MKKVRVEYVGIARIPSQPHSASFQTPISANSLFLCLREVDGVRVAPITISSSRTNSILHAQNPVLDLPPDIFDLMKGLLDLEKIKIKEIIIDKIVERIFHSSVVFDLGDEQKPISLPCQTIDAITFALRCKAQIYFEEELFLKYSTEVNFLPPDMDSPN